MVEICHLKIIQRMNFMFDKIYTKNFFFSRRIIKYTAYCDLIFTTYQASKNNNSYKTNQCMNYS